MSDVLQVKNLSVEYGSYRGAVKAVRDVSFNLKKGEVLGIVGESGSGKSTIAYALMRLLKPPARIVSGQVRYQDGTDVFRLSAQELRRFRFREMALVFQSAMNALNPVMTVYEQIEDTLLAHLPHLTKTEIKDRVYELADLVQMRADRLRAYPHELSGGMRQRAVIAIALALKPKILIMDEPTTALDVVVQRSLLDKVKEIQEQMGLSILFISHDFHLVADFSDWVGVMYAGQLVEMVKATELLAHETTWSLRHPYTEALLKATPSLFSEEVTVQVLGGFTPDLTLVSPGCAFEPRCKRALPQCTNSLPPRVAVDDGWQRCHLRTRSLGRVMNHG